MIYVSVACGWDRVALLAAPRDKAQITQPVYLRVNQVGFLPAELKLALALTNENLGNQTFSVVSTTGATVFSGTVGEDRGSYGNFEALYYQVGDYRDHNYGWRMPERDDMDHPDRTVWVCEGGKGANVAGKVAAALALAAVLWKDPARPFYNPTLASTYLKAAQQIYTYGKARPAAQPSTNDPTATPAFVFYDEKSWQDEMALAAAELYRATGDPAYLSDARNYALAAGSAGSFFWGEVGALAQYEIGRLDSSYAPAVTNEPTVSMNAAGIALSSWYAPASPTSNRERSRRRP